MSALVEDLPTYSSEDVSSMIRLAAAAKEPVMIWGPPGIGKSQVVHQFAGERPVVDIRLLLREPTDLKGIPFYDPQTNTMKWSQPDELPSERNGMLDAVLFLDEISAAPPNVQAATYQLALDRKIGEYELPEGVDIVLAGNRVKDRGVAYKMPAPLWDRLFHVTMRADTEAWITWALQNKIDERIVGFIDQNRKHLFTFDPKAKDPTFATPRGWEKVHNRT